MLNTGCNYMIFLEVKKGVPLVSRFRIHQAKLITKGYRHTPSYKKKIRHPAPFSRLSCTLHTSSNAIKFVMQFALVMSQSTEMHSAATR